VEECQKTNDEMVESPIIKKKVCKVSQKVEHKKHNFYTKAMSRSKGITAP